MGAEPRHRRLGAGARILERQARAVSEPSSSGERAGLVWSGFNRRWLHL